MTRIRSWLSFGVLSLALWLTLGPRFQTFAQTLSTTQPVNVQNGSATATVNGQANVALTWFQFPQLVKGGTAAMTGTTSTQVIASVASNIIYVSSCSVNNTHASVDTLVDLQDGNGGTVIWTFTAPHGFLGESHSFNPPLRVGAVADALFAADETTGASVKIFCQGFASTVAY